MSKRQRPRNHVLSVAEWAQRLGLAEDGRSIAAARTLIAKGKGPTLTPLGKRNGVDLHDHAAWLRTQPWARYLARRAAARWKGLA
jgi:hypothetical protein